MDDETLEDASDEAAAASIVSPSETIELVVLFIVSKDCEDRRADFRRRLYGLQKDRGAGCFKRFILFDLDKETLKGVPNKKGQVLCVRLNCKKLVKERPDR